MINFVVCEDNKIILEKNVEIINKTMFNNNINYRIYKFEDYTNDFKNIIYNSDIKIYILDIELNKTSGIDIAREIRKKDLDSIIIISTAYVEYLPLALKNKLMLYYFISKFEDYEENLSKVINNALDQLKYYQEIKKK